MAQLIRYATNHNSGWTNSQNALASNGLYATSAPAKNGSTYVSFGGFGFDDIPEGSTIDNVQLEAYWKVSTTGSVDTLGVSALVGGSLSGSEFTTTTLTTSMKLDAMQTTGISTRDNLLDGTFGVQVRATRGNTNTAFTASLDYVRATVDYTTPPPAEAQTISATGYADTDGLGLPTITAEIPIQIISLTGYADADGFGPPTVVRGGVNIAPNGYADTDKVGLPTVARGGVTISPNGYADTDGVGNPIITTTTPSLSINPTGLPNQNNFGLSTIARGSVTIYPTGAACTNAPGTPSVSTGPVIVNLNGIQSAVNVGQPSVTSGGAIINATGYADIEGIGSPTITSTTAPILPSGIASTSNIGMPNSTTLANINTAGVTSGSVVGFPSIETITALTLSGIASTSQLGRPEVAEVISVDQTVEATGLSSTVIFGTLWVRYFVTLVICGNISQPVLVGDLKHPKTKGQIKPVLFIKGNIQKNLEMEGTQ
jgi:hypothetical protein